MKPARALEALNFFMADAQAGIGPFIGVFLLARGWGTAAIGSVMTVAGLTAMAVTPFAGALVDLTRAKRALVIVAIVVTTLASLALLPAHRYAAVVASQLVAAVSGAVLAPAITGITLGMVRARGFDRQFGRNQVANHAGNVVGAALAGWIGWRFGFEAVFLLAAAFAVLTIASVLVIPANVIDYASARGLEADQGDSRAVKPPTGEAGTLARYAAASPPVGNLRSLLHNRPLVLLGGSLALFHLGNAAMLPLYGMGVVTAHRGNPSAFTAQTIVIAQLVMGAAAWLAPRLIQARGYWWVLLVSYLALPVRGVLAAIFMSSAGVWPVQILDGIGAALSPVLGGVLVQHIGYAGAFVTLGAISLGALVLWVSHAGTLRHLCGPPLHDSAGSHGH